MIIMVHVDDDYDKQDGNHDKMKKGKRKQKESGEMRKVYVRK